MVNVLMNVSALDVVAEDMRFGGQQELAELSTYQQVLMAWSQVQAGQDNSGQKVLSAPGCQGTGTTNPQAAHPAMMGT